MSLSPVRAVFALSGLLAGIACPLSMSASHSRRGPTAPHHAHGKHTSKSSSHAATSTRPRAMDDARATEIQTALVKAGYLQTSSGHWDQESADAMRKLQADNGWQTKLIPDSRALIKLGLGANSGGSSPEAVNLIGPAE